MVNPTWSSKMKLRRARQLFSEFQTDIDKFYAANPYRLQVYPADDSAFDFVIRNLITPPLHWGFLVGDIVHNARSALDHLTYSLALSNGRSSDELTRIGFPMHPDATTYDRTMFAREVTKVLRPADATRIRELQPFNGGNTAIWPNVNDVIHSPMTVQLHIVSQLDNEDKHRVLKAVGHNVGDVPSRPIVPDGYTADHMINGDLLRDGASVGKWRFEGPVPSVDEIVAMDWATMCKNFPIMPRFEQLGYELPGHPVSLLSWNILDPLESGMNAIGAVLRIFEPSLLRGEPPLPAADALQGPGPY